MVNKKSRKISIVGNNITYYLISSVLSIDKKAGNKKSENDED